MNEDERIELLSFERVGVDLPDGRTLLDEVNLSVGAGAVVGVMGPSGSGKSTLLAVAGGLLEPTRGDVRRTHHATRPSIAWALQSTLALPRRTVLDNVAMGPFAHGVAWREAQSRAAELTIAAGLESCLHTPAGRISGGERQRLGVARAIATRASLVLADEPTAGLDASLVVEIARFIVDHVDHASALVIATHDPRVAQVCSRVYNLDAGRLLDA